jgi:uncharacterized protein (DUF2164 family)
MIQNRYLLIDKDEEKMTEIEFTREEKDFLTRKIQQYIEKELDFEIGGFDAEFLLDFFAKEVGAYFYNKGLSDAKLILDMKLDEMSDALYAIEKPIPFKK